MEDKIREPLRETEAKRILETMNDEYGISKVAEMIKDNKIEFQFNDKNYRVRLLTAKEKDELDFLRRKYFGKLFQDKDILMEKDLIKIYKERGLDIEELDKEIKRLNKKIQSVNYPLGESLANKAGDSILKTYREEIEKLTNELYELMIRRNHLVEYSFEQTLQNYVAKVISFLSLDVKENDTWLRAYNNIDDYLAADERLINLSATYSMTLHSRM
jgi:uncharacterized FlaG/YvyC family protein